MVVQKVKPRKNADLLGGVGTVLPGWAWCPACDDMTKQSLQVCRARSRGDGTPPKFLVVVCEACGVAFMQQPLANVFKALAEVL